LKTYVVEVRSTVTGQWLTIERMQAKNEAAVWLEVLGPKPWDRFKKAQKQRYLIRAE